MSVRGLLTHRVVVLAAWLVYWGLLFASTHLPPQTASAWSFHIADWLLHVLAFAILATLTFAASAAGGRRVTPLRTALWFGVLLAYAAIDEISQPPFGRHMQLSDWLADASGVAIGLLVGMIWQVLSGRPPAAQDR